MSWTPSDSPDSFMALADSMGVYPECGCEIGDCRCPDEPVLALVEEPVVGMQIIIPTTGPASMTQAEVERVYREFDGFDRQVAARLMGHHPTFSVQMLTDAECEAHTWNIVRYLRA